MPLFRRKKAQDAGREADATRGDGKGAAAPDVAQANSRATEVMAASPDGEDAATAQRDGHGEGGGPGDAAIAMVDADAGAATGAETAPEAELDTETIPDAELEPEGGAEEEAVPAAEPVAAAAPAPEGDGGERLPVGFYLEGLLKNDRAPSREELDRQAEADFRAAIAPSVAQLRELVPDASSPEEALRELTERWDEPLPDPEGEQLRGQDSYKRGPAETAVFYRIRRHFEQPTRHVGFGRENWRPPSSLHRETRPSTSRKSLPSGGRRTRQS